MADNITLADGTVVAMDDIGGVKHQRAKLSWGVDGAAVDTSHTSPMPTVSAAAVIAFTPTLDTAAYASNDVLFAPVELANVVSATGLCVQPVRLKVINSGLICPSFSLWFFDRSVTFGTINAAVSLSDADSLFFLGKVDVLVSDWATLPNNSFVDLPLALDVMKPNATSLWVAGRVGIGETPTFASASAWKITLAYLKA